MTQPVQLVVWAIMLLVLVAVTLIMLNHALIETQQFKQACHDVGGNITLEGNMLVCELHNGTVLEEVPQ